MWVQDSLAGQESWQQASVWDRLNPLNLGSRHGPPPVQVEVRWYDGWSMTNLTDHKFRRPDAIPLDGASGEAADLSTDASQAAADKPEDQHDSALAAV